MIDKLIAFLKSKLSALVTIIIAVVVTLFFGGHLALLDDRVAVEIYKSDGVFIYCSSGSLAPPAQYIGSGKISADKASSC